MTPPRATYRLQFRGGMDFERAAGLADYLARLGISHLYASPLFAAVQGSTHGYDGIDFSEMDPELGGEPGFDRLTKALDAAGLCLLLDFVPNHMAASEANGWWRSVLEWGAASPVAAIFDIDWAAPHLLLPILGAPYGEALGDGTIGLAFDASTGSITVTVHDRHLPMTPPSYAAVLDATGDRELAALGRSFTSTSPAQAESLRRRLAERASSHAAGRAIQRTLAGIANEPSRLHALLEAQVWRLAHWRLAREALTYRRFFEIADLVCLRVEQPAVFEAVHARLLDLVTSGRVAGVRLDHVDGLADPPDLFRRLHAAFPGESPPYLLVEKILEPGERLRPDWPVAGTTGYEFIAALAGLFVDQAREGDMTAAYTAFTGDGTDYQSEIRRAKSAILEYNLAAELRVLTDRAAAIAAADVRTRDLGRDALRRAIVALVAALPVYRTYVSEAGADETDRSLIAGAADEARTRPDIEDPAPVDFLAGLLRLEPLAADQHEAALGFALRFQQTSGPAMAKAVEDTVFYRFNRLIALNEVGGSPETYGTDADAFHAAMADRRLSQPAGLSATATHDTKRGEDARARLYVLSEMPEEWEKAVARWHRMNSSCRARLIGGPAPEPRIEWLFYQALLGAWPASLWPDGADREDSSGVADLRGRMKAYLEKAVREAKLRTTWTGPKADYEAAIAAFVEGVLSPSDEAGFLADFHITSREVWISGAINSLSQLAIKLFAPGVPDIYQGCELWDFSLVDPDNRSPVDFRMLRRMIERVEEAPPETSLAEWRSGAPKLALTLAGLRARADHPGLFAEGSYHPLEIQGERSGNVVAFARTSGAEAALAIVPRFVLSMEKVHDRPLVVPEQWGDTRVKLPSALRNRPLRDLVTGTHHSGGASLSLAETHDRFPVALLLAG